MDDAPSAKTAEEPVQLPEVVLSEEKAGAALAMPSDDLLHFPADLMLPALTFEEPPGDIEANMRGFGWDLAKWRKESRLAFVDASPTASDELVVGDYDLAG